MCAHERDGHCDFISGVMIDDEVVPKKPPLPVGCRRPPPLSGLHRPPSKPLLPNSRFYDSGSPTNPIKSAPSSQPPVRSPPVRSPPARPSPLRAPPARLVPARHPPANKSSSQQSKSTFYVEHLLDVPPLPSEEALSAGFSPKAGKPLPVKNSPKAGKPLPQPQKQLVNGKPAEMAASPTAAVTIERAGSTRSTSPPVVSNHLDVDGGRKPRTLSARENHGKTDKDSDSSRVGRSKSLYHRPQKSISPEPSARQVALDDSHLARLRKEVTGSPPPPPRPSLPKAFAAEKSSQAVEEKRIRSKSSPPHTVVNNSSASEKVRQSDTRKHGQAVYLLDRWKDKEIDKKIDRQTKKQSDRQLRNRQ